MRTREEILSYRNPEDLSPYDAVSALLETALDIRDQLATLTEHIGGEHGGGTVIGNLIDIEEAVKAFNGAWRARGGGRL